MGKDQVTKSVVEDIDDLLGVAEMIDQDTVEKPNQMFPIVQWVNGKPSNKKAGDVSWTGGWFISQTAAVGVEVLSGWTKDSLITRDGAEIPGFFKKDIQVAVLHYRRRWRITSRDGKTSRFFPWNQYDEAKAEGRPSGNLQVLCWLKEADMLNPIVLTLKGLVGAEFTGGRNADGVLGSFTRKVIGTMNNALRVQGSNKSLPWRAFWLTVGPRMKPDGSPEFTSVGEGTATSTISLPSLIGVSDKPTAAEVKPLFVGKELLATLNSLWGDPRVTDWAASWDVIQNQGDTAGETETKQRITVSDVGDASGVSDIGDGPIPF
jgi:hypothetical protein